MNIIHRLLAVVSAVGLLGACVTGPGEDTPEAAEAQVMQPLREPAAADPAAPAPEPTPTPTSTRPEIFSFSGETTQGGWIRGRVPYGTVSAKLGDTPLAFGEEGRFFAAFDRDAGRQAVLTAVLEDGRTIRSPLAVSPREWDIERVNVAKRPGGASAAFLRRRRPELEQIYLARERETGAEGWKQSFVWPAKGRISGRFGAQRIYRGEPGSYHTGLDISTGESGSPFVSPADGVVVLVADDFSLEGRLIIIDHGQGLNSAFLHASRILVREGDKVRRGQHIGDIGSSGRATGPHLHWSLKWRDARLDPLLFVDQGG